MPDEKKRRFNPLLEDLPGGSSRQEEQAPKSKTEYENPLLSDLSGPPKVDMSKPGGPILDYPGVSPAREPVEQQPSEPPGVDIFKPGGSVFGPTQEPPKVGETPTPRVDIFKPGGSVFGPIHEPLKPAEPAPSDQGLINKIGERIQDITGQAVDWMAESVDPTPVEQQYGWLTPSPTQETEPPEEVPTGVSPVREMYTGRGFTTKDGTEVKVRDVKDDLVEYEFEDYRTGKTITGKMTKEELQREPFEEKMIQLPVDRRVGAAKPVDKMHPVEAGFARFSEAALDTMSGGRPKSLQDQPLPTTGEDTLDTVVDTLGFVSGLFVPGSPMQQAFRLSADNALRVSPLVASKLNLPLRAVQNSIRGGTSIGLLRGTRADVAGEPLPEVAKEAATGVGIGIIAGLAETVAGPTVDRLAKKFANSKISEKFYGEPGIRPANNVLDYMKHLHERGSFVGTLGFTDALLDDEMGAKEAGLAGLVSYGFGVGLGAVTGAPKLKAPVEVGSERGFKTGFYVKYDKDPKSGRIVPYFKVDPLTHNNVQSRLAWIQAHGDLNPATQKVASSMMGDMKARGTEFVGDKQFFIASGVWEPKELKGKPLFTPKERAEMAKRGVDPSKMVSADRLSMKGFPLQGTKGKWAMWQSPPYAKYEVAPRAAPYKSFGEQAFKPTKPVTAPSKPGAVKRLATPSQIRKTLREIGIKEGTKEASWGAKMYNKFREQGWSHDDAKAKVQYQNLKVAKGKAHDEAVKETMKTRMLGKGFSRDQVGQKLQDPVAVDEFAHKTGVDQAVTPAAPLIPETPTEKEPVEAPSRMAVSRTTTDMPRYDEMLEKPEYFRDKKGIEFQVVDMHPYEYRELVSELQEIPMDRQEQMIDEGSLEYLGKEVQEGRELPLLTLDYDQQTQEGRNRAYLAEQQGLESIPVMVVYPKDQPPSVIREAKFKPKRISPEEVAPVGEPLEAPTEEVEPAAPEAVVTPTPEAPDAPVIEAEVTPEVPAEVPEAPVVTPEVEDPAALAPTREEAPIEEELTVDLPEYEVVSNETDLPGKFILQNKTTDELTDYTFDVKREAQEAARRLTETGELPTADVVDEDIRGEMEAPMDFRVTTGNEKNIPLMHLSSEDLASEDIGIMATDAYEVLSWLGMEYNEETNEFNHDLDKTSGQKEVVAEAVGEALKALEGEEVDFDTFEAEELYNQFLAPDLSEEVIETYGSNVLRILNALEDSTRGPGPEQVLTPQKDQELREEYKETLHKLAHKMAKLGIPEETRKLVGTHLAKVLEGAQLAGVDIKVNVEFADQIAAKLTDDLLKSHGLAPGTEAYVAGRTQIEADGQLFKATIELLSNPSEPIIQEVVHEFAEVWVALWEIGDAKDFREAVDFLKGKGFGEERAKEFLPEILADYAMSGGGSDGDPDYDDVFDKLTDKFKNWVLDTMKRLKEFMERVWPNMPKNLQVQAQNFADGKWERVFREYKTNLDIKQERYSIKNKGFAPPFYSKLYQHMEQKAQKKMTKDQALALLKKAPVKQDEIEWSGLIPFIQTHPHSHITKEELLSQFQSRELDEVVLGSSSRTPEIVEAEQEALEARREVKAQYQEKIMPLNHRIVQAGGPMGVVTIPEEIDFSNLNVELMDMWDMFHDYYAEEKISGEELEWAKDNILEFQEFCDEAEAAEAVADAVVGQEPEAPQYEGQYWKPWKEGIPDSYEERVFKWAPPIVLDSSQLNREFFEPEGYTLSFDSEEGEPSYALVDKKYDRVVLTSASVRHLIQYFVGQRWEPPELQQAYEALKSNPQWSDREKLTYLEENADLFMNAYPVQYGFVRNNMHWSSAPSVERLLENFMKDAALAKKIFHSDFFSKMAAESKGEQEYISDHFPNHPNTVGWYRADSVYGTRPGEKLKRLGELQSDWHGDAREHGYWMEDIPETWSITKERIKETVDPEEPIPDMPYSMPGSVGFSFEDLRAKMSMVQEEDISQEEMESILRKGEQALDHLGIRFNLDTGIIEMPSGFSPRAKLNLVKGAIDVVNVGRGLEWGQQNRVVAEYFNLFFHEGALEEGSLEFWGYDIMFVLEALALYDPSAFVPEGSKTFSFNIPLLNTGNLVEVFGVRHSPELGLLILEDEDGLERLLEAGKEIRPYYQKVRNVVYGNVFTSVDELRRAFNRMSSETRDFAKFALGPPEEFAELESTVTRERKEEYGKLIDRMHSFMVYVCGNIEQLKSDGVEVKTFSSKEENDYWVLQDDKGKIRQVINSSLVKTEEEARERFKSAMQSSSVPPAPFSTNWAEYFLKRAIRAAVEEGKDALIWSDGEVQSARGNLSTHGVVKVEWEREARKETVRESIIRNQSLEPDQWKPAYFYTIKAHKADGSRGQVWGKPEEELGAILGADLAKKIIAEDRDRGSYESAEEFRVGGFGKYATYGYHDRRTGEYKPGMYTKFLEKYLKQWGAKIEQIEYLDGSTPHTLPEEAEGLLQIDYEGRTVHYYKEDGTTERVLVLTADAPDPVDKVEFGKGMTEYIQENNISVDKIYTPAITIKKVYREDDYYEWGIMHNAFPEEGVYDTYEDNPTGIRQLMYEVWNSTVGKYAESMARTAPGVRFTEKMKEDVLYKGQPMSVKKKNFDAILETYKTVDWAVDEKKPDKKKDRAAYVLDTYFQDREEAKLALEAKDMGFVEWKNRLSEIDRSVLKKYVKPGKPRDMHQELIKKTENITESQLEALGDQLRKEMKSEFKFTKEQRKAIREMQKETKKMLKQDLRPEFKKEIENLLQEVDWSATYRSKRKVDRLKSTREFLEKNPDASLPDSVLKELEILGKKPLHEMSFDEVNSMFNSVKHLVKLNELKNVLIQGRQRRKVEEAVSQANKLIKEAGGKARGFHPEAKKLDTRYQTKEPGAIKKILTTDSFLPEYLCQIVQGKDEGIISDLLYKQVHDAYNKKYELWFEARDHLREAIGDTDVIPWSHMFNKKLKDTEVISLKLPGLPGDRKMKVTKGERMSLYLHSLHPYNRENLIKGGFRFPHKQGVLHNITEEDLEYIVNSMSDKEKEIADAMSKYLNTKQRKNLNEVSLRIDGYEVATIDPYWPVHRAAVRHKKDPLPKVKAKNLQHRILENMGLLKSREEINMPILLNDAFQTFFGNVQDATGYAAFVEPIRNARMLLRDEEFTGTLHKQGLKHYHEALDKYIDDIEGNISQLGNLDRLTLDWLNRIHVSILGFNPGVMLKQPTSYLAASSEIDINYMIKAAPTKVAWDEIHKYSPQLKYRDEGKINREVGEIGEVGGAYYFFTGKHLLPHKFTAGIRAFDRLTVGRIWNAVKLETQDKHPNLKGDAFYKHVAERVEHVVNRTQPTYLPHTRSAIGRSPSPHVRLLTPFHTQRNKNYNIKLKALWEYENSNKKPKDKAKLMKKLFLLLLATPMYLMSVDELRDRFYKREVDKSVLTKALDMVSFNLGTVYVVGHVFDSIKSKIERGKWGGFEVVDPFKATIWEGTDAVIDTLDAIEAVITQEEFETGAKEGEKKWKTAVTRMIDSSANFSSKLWGIPYYNVKKVSESTLKQLAPDLEFKIDSIGRSPQSSYYYGRLWDRIDAGRYDRAEDAMKILIKEFNVSPSNLQQSFRGREDLSREHYSKALEIYKKARRSN